MQCAHCCVVKMADGEENPSIILNYVEVDTISDESIAPAQPESRESECEESLESWLSNNALASYLDEMKKNGLTSVSHLEDITEADAMSDLNMSKFQARRLIRSFKEWKLKKSEQVKKEKEQPKTANFKPRLVTNNKAIVVTLPPAFQGFLGTRDGGTSVVVSTSSLAKKWKNLYYKNPLNPFQNFSNGFMLKMCESQQYKFKTTRQCEKWAREERDKRITLLLAMEKNTKGWSPYYRKKSVYGSLSALQEKYPVVPALTEESVKKADYECCVDFKNSLESLDLYTVKGHEEMMESAIEDALEPSGSVKSGIKNPIN